MRSWSIVLTLVFACGDKDDNTTGDTTDEADADTDTDTDADADADADADTDTDADADPQQSDARFVNTSEAIGTVTVYADGSATPVLPMLPSFLGTPFAPVQVGMHTFAIAPEAAPPTEAIASSTGQYDLNKRYSLVVFGTPSAPVLTQVLEDIMNPPLAMGSLRYRFWNVVDTIPSIDVTDEGTDMFLADDLAYGPATETVDLPAGPRTVLVDTDNDGVDEYRYSIPGVGVNAVVSFFFTMQAGVPVLLGQPAGGAIPVALQPEILTVDDTDAP
jgi:hypothetical protein